MKKIKTNNKTVVFALGGLEEVGKNTYCIEHNNEIIIIDAGLKFPEKILLGVDAIIPDYDYLIKNANKIKGLFITHGHEDHIGGIPHLVKKVNIPKIYSPYLASDLIKNKLRKSKKQPEIVEIDHNSVVKTQHFTINFFQVTHSIPNAFGIIIKTPNGTIVTTGDFKFDWTPLNKKTELDKIAEIGKSGVTLLLSDSTNSEIPGYTITEQKIIENISFLMKNSRKRIFITTFASNFNRIFAIMLAAQKTNRKVVIIGKAIQNIIKIINKRKYFKIDPKILIDESKINNYSPDKLIVICTGSQGESNSAVNKIATGNHPNIIGGSQDMIIFSSKPIPGNFYDVEHVINQLQKRGMQVKISSVLSQLHTSGHACQEEQKIMLSLIKPTYFMPMHGEYRMLKIHGETAKKIGIPDENIFICQNGDQIYLHNQKAWKGSKIPVSSIFLGKNQKQEETFTTLNERQKMLKGGVALILITIDQINKKLLGKPQLFLKGSFYKKNELTLNRKLIDQLTLKTKTFLKQNHWNEKTLHDQIKQLTEQIIFDDKKINPLISVIIMLPKS